MWIFVTDVGTDHLDKDAWNTITEKADGSSVALTVEEKIGGGWTVSAVNASGDPVFSAEDDSRKGEITVSVPYTPAQELAQGDKVVVYYVSEDGQLESMTTIYEAGTLSWTTDHLSDFIGVIIGEDDEAVWVSNGAITTGKLATALADPKFDGGNIYLVKDAAFGQRQVHHQQEYHHPQRRECCGCPRHHRHRRRWSYYRRLYDHRERRSDLERREADG